MEDTGHRSVEVCVATAALIPEFVWLNGEPLAVIEGGVVNFVRVDHIGRPVFATNTAATKTWTASYLPFGEVRTTTGTPIALRFPDQWFQSGEEDEKSLWESNFPTNGLHQNWMREYDPTTGKFLEADPLGLVDGASIYGYVKGNPGKWVDPKSLQCSYYSRMDGTAGINCTGPTTYCPSGDCGWRDPPENNSEYDQCMDSCELSYNDLVGSIGGELCGAVVAVGAYCGGTFEAAIAAGICYSAHADVLCRR